MSPQTPGWQPPVRAVEQRLRDLHLHWGPLGRSHQRGGDSRRHGRGGLRAPATDGGSAITAYTVSASPPVSGATQTCLTAGETSCVVTGLTNGQPYSFTVTAANAGSTSEPSLASAPVTPFLPGAAGTAPPAPPTTWTGGQVVELTTQATTALGGYGLWNRESSSYVNGVSIEDRAAYLFPMNQTLAAGKKLRVHFGGTNPLPAASADIVDLSTGMTPFVQATGDFVELASLSRSSLGCELPRGVLPGCPAVSISSSPVGVTARTTPSSVTVDWGAPISRGGAAITQYTATAYDAPIGRPRSPRASRAARSERARSRAGSAPSTTSRSWRTTLRGSPGRRGVSLRLRGRCPARLGTWPSPGHPVGSTCPGHQLPRMARPSPSTRPGVHAGNGGNPVGSFTASNGSLTSARS